jgi:hypothetical protein
MGDMGRKKKRRSVREGRWSAIHPRLVAGFVFVRCCLLVLFWVSPWPPIRSSPAHRYLCPCTTITATLVAAFLFNGCSGTHMTHDTQHTMIHMTQDTRHTTHDTRPHAHAHTSGDVDESCWLRYMSEGRGGEVREWTLWLEVE